MVQSKKVQKKSGFNTFIIGGCSLVIVVVAIFFIINYTSNSENDSSPESNAEVNVIDSDLIIPISEVTETGKFYPITFDDTDMEIIVVKGTDDSIKMAFNTCEICYSSGKGYYKQSGDKIICQNCGNSYTMDQVGQLGRGGCNPYSIFDTDVKIDSENITIPKEFLTESKSIFANWKY